MATADESQGPSKPRTTLGAALLVSYTMLVAWIFYDQSASWPHEGSWAYFVLFLLCPGILFQSVSLAYTRRTGRALTRRALVRVVTIPLGLLLAGALASWASTLAMGGFAQAYAPFVSQVSLNLADPCRLASRYFDVPAVVAYNLRAQREHPVAKLKYDSKRFVLSFNGGSMDMDGSTIYYDSVAKAWQKFHNDNATASAPFSELSQGLAECSLRVQQATKTGAD